MPSGAPSTPSAHSAATVPQPPSWRAVVLSPLSVERAPLKRACLGEISRAGGTPADARAIEFLLTGIGADRITAAVAALAARPPGTRPGLVVLAGTAGGLVDGVHAPPIAAVVDEHGHRWSPTVTTVIAQPLAATQDQAQAPAATVLGVDRLIPTPQQKRALAARTGATIVDMESHAFARACESAGLRWAVVRGVSDGPDDHLPEFIMRWFTAAGRARPLVMTADILTHPGAWPGLARLSRRTKGALAQAGASLATLLTADRSRA